MPDGTPTPTPFDAGGFIDRVLGNNPTKTPTPAPNPITKLSDSEIRVLLAAGQLNRDQVVAAIGEQQTRLIESKALTSSERTQVANLKANPPAAAPAPSSTGTPENLTAAQQDARAINDAQSQNQVALTPSTLPVPSAAGSSGRASSGGGGGSAEPAKPKPIHFLKGQGWVVDSGKRDSEGRTIWSEVPEPALAGNQSPDPSNPTVRWTRDENTGKYVQNQWSVEDQAFSPTGKTADMPQTIPLSKTGEALLKGVGLPFGTENAPLTRGFESTGSLGGGETNIYDVNKGISDVLSSRLLPEGRGNEAVGLLGVPRAEGNIGLSLAGLGAGGNPQFVGPEGGTSVDMAQVLRANRQAVPTDPIERLKAFLGLQQYIADNPDWQPGAAPNLQTITSGASVLGPDIATAKGGNQINQLEALRRRGAGLEDINTEDPFASLDSGQPLYVKDRQAVMAGPNEVVSGTGSNTVFPESRIPFPDAPDLTSNVAGGKRTGDRPVTYTEGSNAPTPWERLLPGQQALLESQAQNGATGINAQLQAEAERNQLESMGLGKDAAGGGLIALLQALMGLGGGQLGMPKAKQTRWALPWERGGIVMTNEDPSAPRQTRLNYEPFFGPSNVRVNVPGSTGSIPVLDNGGSVAMPQGGPVMAGPNEMVMRQPMMSPFTQLLERFMKSNGRRPGGRMAPLEMVGAGY